MRAAAMHRLRTHPYRKRCLVELATLNSWLGLHMCNSPEPGPVPQTTHKMSKSRGNVVSPDNVVADYGAE